MLSILYEDEFMVVINKPHGLLVHRSMIAKDATEFAVQLLRDQVGCKVHPAHRLDRKTGGVLLFAKNPEVDRALKDQFAQKTVYKEYRAILRGHVPLEGTIDYPLHRDDGKLQNAVTNYERLATSEIPIQSDRYPSSRYSLVKVLPETGRMHQIRKHFAHIRYPIIGDRPHGCNKQNRFFKTHFNMDTMTLHALTLAFVHPVSKERVSVEAPLQSEFARMLEELKLK